MEHSAEARALRQCMDDFLEKRCAEKLKGIGDEAKRAREEARFQRETWLADAARRASQISLVTHALKYGHPDARGSSLYVDDATVPEGYVGTSSCRTIHEDVVGNAAALDVFDFLKLEHAGKSLLQCVMENDDNLRAAFSDDAELAAGWMAAFRRMKESEERPASHTLARQVYFPLEKGGYHLLAPLFPTSLVQHVHLILQEDRFGEAAKEAREARREERFCAHGYCEYHDMLVRKFGGTKPQNISWLNSRRHGENWLLASLPPVWKQDRVRLPLGVESVFGAVLDGLPELEKARTALIAFLEKASGAYTNIHIREKRAALLEDMISVVVQWAARIRGQEGGWSAGPECRLSEEERFWLDPGRGETDPEWRQRRADGQWLEPLLKRAATWFNARLTTPKLRMGDEERHVWKREIAAAVRQLEEGGIA